MECLEWMMVFEWKVGVGRLRHWRMSFELVRPAQSVLAWIDPWYFCFSSFWILYILHSSYQMARSIPKSCCSRKPEFWLCVRVPRSPSYTLESCIWWPPTLYLVTTRSLWSIRDFSWIHTITINVQISFVWRESVRESTVVVLCWCPLACHLCWWHLSKRWCFGWISHFGGSRAFEYYMYCTELIHCWNLYNSCCQRTVQCNLQVWVHLWAFWYPYIWLPRGHFDPFVIFSRFLVLI
jgi:hypothetical protein